MDSSDDRIWTRTSPWVVVCCSSDECPSAHVHLDLGELGTCFQSCELLAYTPGPLRLVWCRRGCCKNATGRVAFRRRNQQRSWAMRCWPGGQICRVIQMIQTHDIIDICTYSHRSLSSCVSFSCFVRTIAWQPAPPFSVYSARRVSI